MSSTRSASTAQAKAFVRSYLRRRRTHNPPHPETAQGFERALAPLWQSLPAGSTLAAFLPLPTEPPLLPALTRAVAEGYRVLVPVVRPRRQLAWVEWQPQVEHTVNALGIVEPVGERHGAEAFIQADLRLVPALAYDLAGRRLGQGGGYYDRLFEQLGPLAQDPSTVGVVFEREILDGLPADSWDATLRFVATEKTLHRLGN
ncbi:5-formyltetrahydrofolate cyclo-ligase [Rothia sp. SD9660Na]|uniref:5-formyltetrahydrofolate cyclo-ligase n=1 Tax=Rothia sp. SD9660Na TaxID=3047030 RepID=UPI0024BA59D0|nr:5-formyltetrahydrofolate cyclo-ligase [Rothia sp. SD9660Na]WHS51015.1 5-formyltetrahydrofolate cyclo-ligase [Rothia sp. SD9660Na]